MNVLDRARIVGATLSYDLWLDFAGVPGRRRRDLRRELRANLGAATALVGSRDAIRGLGSTREMAGTEDDFPRTNQIEENPDRNVPDSLVNIL